MSNSDEPPTKSIVVSQQQGNLPPVDTAHRAVHEISLSALSHNYAKVESAANRQRCSVIVVVKGDGYGHGAIATSLYLADHLGADSFAVATLEEGIALRKAFQDAFHGNQHITSSTTKPAFVGRPHAGNPVTEDSVGLASKTTVLNLNGSRRRSMRPSQIRILVLGPPVGFPRCFDDYFHHNIEVMISGPEVANALLEWVYNTEERKRTQVERAATEAKEQALKEVGQLPKRSPAPAALDHRNSVVSEDSTGNNSQDFKEASDPGPRFHQTPVTLGSVTGLELAQQVRDFLKHQQKAVETHQTKQLYQLPSVDSKQGSSSPTSSIDTPPKIGKEKRKPPNTLEVPLATQKPAQVFRGIEEAAKISRTRHKAMTSEVFTGDGDDEGNADRTGNEKDLADVAVGTRNPQAPAFHRKRLRWHALVDSGMGRLGFRTDPVSMDELGKRRDTVEILRELVDLEVKLDCPVEFFGMCTHMADALSSEYTNLQIAKFKALVKRVRAAGISIPTISTDNSAALLATHLNHFDSRELLTQEFADTRGYVRTGGAIYGQRPSFPQLRAVSTLTASVRHIAVLKTGESVGYDRAYIASKNIRVATLTIGFADGYPRELGNGVGKVCIRGHLFPVVGNVCMDMLMVELGPAEEPGAIGAQVVVGDTAILWGPSDDEDCEGLVRLQDVSTTLKTTQSALTCGIDKERVARHYA